MFGNQLFSKYAASFNSHSNTTFDSNSIDEPTKKEWIKIQQEHNDYMEKLRAPGKEFGSQFSNTVTLLILSTWMGLALMMIPVRR